MVAESIKSCVAVVPVHVRPAHDASYGDFYVNTASNKSGTAFGGVMYATRRTMPQADLYLAMSENLEILRRHYKDWPCSLMY